MRQAFLMTYDRAGSIVPIHAARAWHIEDTPPDGFGSLLSILTGGLIKDAPDAPSRVDIQREMALSVTTQMLNNCQTAPDDKVAASVGYNINQFNAWDQVLTDGNIVQQIINKTISDLLSSNLVTVSPGCANAGTAIGPSGVLPTVPVPQLTITPQMLMIGGGGLLALLLLGGHHAKRK